MTTESLAFANQQLRAQPLWHLLASDHGYAVLAILETHLFERDRTLPSSVLSGRLKEDLKRLRAAGTEIAQSPDRLLAQWLSAGYLIRRLPAGAAEEEFELSLESVTAIRFLRGLRQPRATATESRLSLVIGQLLELEQATQDSPKARIAALLAERERIDREIEDAQAGRWQPMAPDRAKERAREVLALADELLADFRRVKSSFETLHRKLREQIMESDMGRGDVLESLFYGVDVIAASDPGKSFAAFYALLMDNERTSILDGAVGELLRRGFANDLEARERKTLRGLTTLLFQESRSVHEVMQGFARSLKEFVRSTEFRELKRLNTLIKDAERNALLLKEMLKPHTRIDMELDLSSAEIGSVSEHKLYDPAEAFQGGGMEEDAQVVSLEDMAELFAHTEIDYAALENDIRAVLAEVPQATVGEVLARRPATQGLGSVIGLLKLAGDQGVVTGGREVVEWTGLDGQRRQGDIWTAFFRREDDHAG